MERPNYYAIIPAIVRYDENLTPNAKLLYGEITALCNRQGYCFATNEYFAQLYNVSIKSISNWINTLKNKNYIKIETCIKDMEENFQTGRKIFLGGIEENFQHNNTSINNKENIIINNNIKEKSIKFKKPTIEEIKQYCSERNNKIDAEHFYDYYESNGWKVGRNPMKDWKATIRTWERNSRNNKQDDDSYLNDPMYQFSETEEEKIMRYKYGYVAGAFTKEDLEKERISIPIGEEYEYIRSRI